MLQWKTAEAVTSAIVLTEIQRQKTTASFIRWLFILARSSMLKICSWFSARRAMTLLTGFMMAASALMGRRCTVLPAARSTITTLAWPFTCSHTHTNLSDSMVVVPNLT